MASTPEQAYRPSAFYFRKALRDSKNRAQAISVGMVVVAELESLKEWIREQGYIPPKTHLLRAEIDAKDWADS